MTSSRIHEQRDHDPRALATRQRLLRAFVELATTQHTPVSVADVAARAGVHRSSFYAHFRGVDDLAVLAVHEQLDQIHADNLRRHRTGSMGEEDSNLLVLQEILAWGKSPPALLLAATHHDRAVAEQALAVALRDYVLDYYRAVPAYSALTARRLSVSADYVGSALSALVCGWLADEVPLTQAELVRHLGLLVPAWVMRPELVDAMVHR